MKSDFRRQYNSEVKPALMTKLHCNNIHAVPSLKKVVINMGLGGRKLDEKGALDTAAEGLAAITGQKPCVTTVRKSIAGFKIREGNKIGLKVTLRGDRMFEFVQRLVMIAMPRIRDFRGLSSKSFDGRGNFSMGIREYYVFPEIKYDKITDILGMDITFVTSAKTDEQGKELLQSFNVPFYK